MDSLDNRKFNSGLKPDMLIINPVSGKKLALRYIPQMIRALMDGGYLVTTVVTGKGATPRILPPSTAGSMI